VSAVAVIGNNTSDTPVWWLVVVTSALVAVTGALAVAAFLALGQVRITLGQLTAAVAQLDEMKQDRHVQVFADLGQRWQSAEMAEALLLEQEYTPTGLARLFERKSSLPTWNPLRRRRGIRDRQAEVVLLRIPNYFEDAILTAKAGSLNEELFAENFGGVVIAEWAKWSAAIEVIQRTKDELAYIEFAKFATKVQADDAARGVNL